MDDLFSFAASKPNAGPPKPRDKTPDSSKAEETEILSVTAFTRKVKRLLEGQLGKVRIEGEISNLREQASGHRYFTLKDDGSQVSCVLFRGDGSRLRLPMEDGQKVAVEAEVSVYEPRGQYQLIVRKVRLQGEGELQARFEALKRKLHAEGLFDEEQKRDIPAFPRTICLVTSPTGAAVRDMLNVLRRRAPWVKLFVYPVRVQGAEAAPEIVEALDVIAKHAGSTLPEIDTVLLARGGGSLEDLWPFNEEAVARAVATFPLPIISGVGHEIDFTIADFAADLRAPTPSAAAELATPDREELGRQLDGIANTLHATAKRRLENLDQRLDYISRHNLQREVRTRISRARERLQRAEVRMHERVDGQLREAKSICDNAARTLRLQHPRRKLAAMIERVETLSTLMAKSARRRVESAEKRVAQLDELLTAASPESIFQRGFSVALDKNGNVVRDATQLERGDSFQVLFSKTRLEAEVLDVEGEEAR
ncbi:MAG: exodeoxyribonuclease VII large subunit [Verrucomicrobiota bacterium]